MCSSQSHAQSLGSAAGVSWVDQLATSTVRCSPRNLACLILGVVAIGFVFGAPGPTLARAKGVQPGFFSVKPHESLPLREVAEPPAEFERVIDPQKYFETPVASQAGAHPDLTVSVVFNVESTQTALNDEDVPARYEIELPPGLVANFGAIPGCALTAFESTVYNNETPHCSAASQIGVVSALFGGILPDRSYPLYKINIQNLFGTHGGHLAAIGLPYELITQRVPIILRADLRTDGDYGMTLMGRSAGFPEFLPAPFFTFWGEPWSPSHDFERWNPDTQQWGASVEQPPVPFITTSSDCNSGVVESRVQVKYRLEPEHWFPDDPEDFAYRSFLPEAAGCENIAFSPRVDISPTSSAVDSSSGLNVDLEMPRGGLGAQEPPPLKNVSVTLPIGVSVNPATLNGQGGCSPGQVGLLSTSGSSATQGLIHFELGEAHCPDPSKIGVGSASTPLADEPVKAAIYLATPYENPFHSLIAIYVVFESMGFTIKLAGKVDVDPATGQLTAKMEDLPQIPLERLELKFFDGPRAPLASPQNCGQSDALTRLVPWSAPESGPTTESLSRLRFEQEASGQRSCPDIPTPSRFEPAFTAGMRDVTAGAQSSFIVRAERPQGDQALRSISMKLPRGVSANLQGVSACADTSIAHAEGRSGPGGGALELGDPSCPESSKVGVSAVGIGTGSIPLFSQGSVYLAGPYRGAPLSLVVVTPAIAGGNKEKPLLDLGIVVVRVALRVDRRSGQVTAISDALPQMIGGIPLRIDDLRLLLNRSDFVRSPTSCAVMKVDANIEGSEGSRATSASRFQLGGCRRLRFRPKLTIEADRRGSHHGSPGLRAVVTARAGEGNIARASLTLPASIFRGLIRNGKSCPNELLLRERCPQGSIYGHVMAWSPLVSERLGGPVHLTSVKGRPTLALALAGPVPLAALVEIRPERRRSQVTMSGLPDLPLSRLALSLRGGGRGVSLKHDLCERPGMVVSELTSYSGSVSRRHTSVEKLCGDRNGRIHHSHSILKPLGEGRSK
jgi:hypothetical protein